MRPLICAVLVGACSSSVGPANPPLVGPPPTPQLSLGFGDPPLTGTLSFEETPDRPGSLDAGWRFSVDLDGDGSSEAEGDVGGGVRVPYSFDRIGVHRVVVTYRRGDERVETTVSAVVNDPNAVEEIASVVIEGREVLEGIVVSPDGRSVFVSQVFADLIIRLESGSLARLDEVVSGFPGRKEGLAVSPDGNNLYVTSRPGALQVRSIVDLQEISTFPELTSGGFFAEAVSGDRVYLGGQGLSLINSRDGAVLRDLNQRAVWHFALSPDEQTIALLTRDNGIPNEIWLLDSSDFSIQWTADLGVTSAAILAFSIGFSRDGNKVYVMLGPILGPGDWSFQVRSASDGSLISEMFLGRPGCEGVFCEGLANPVATSASGQYLVFATGAGAIWVDRDLDLPMFRSAPLSRFCCNVAASPTSEEFYFAGFFSNSVTRVRLREPR